MILGDGTCFSSEFAPKMQIMLSKSVNSPVAEVAEVISDTELKVRREFGGESGKVTTRIREKVAELQASGRKGLEFKTLPFVDQQDMYRHVYQCLKEGGCIGIFPEGWSNLFQSICHGSTIDFSCQAAVTIAQTCFP
jgi:glycerol-3-phosphate O-acyltransferase/dihydroxyacetone phosphate acyltransferase